MEFLLCTKVSGAGDKSFLNTRNVVFFFFFFFFIGSFFFLFILRLFVCLFVLSFRIHS